MAIKQEAYDIYFSKHAAEEVLAKKLGEAFDVTFGDRINQLSFWLLQPQRHTAERFGLHQELLAIYSGHSSTDARCLTAIEQLMSEPQFKQRVEPVLFVVVHEGDPAEAKELIAHQRDRIIVMIEAATLRTAAGTFVSSAIAEAIGQLDLFGVSSPIKSDTYFFGREELVQQLIARCYVQKENTGLFGLRKTGKTSVLFALQRRLKDRQVLVEYFDCQNPGIHAVRWWNVLSNIMQRVGILVKQRFKRDAKLIADYTESNAGTLFSSDVQTVLHEGQLDQLVLMLDEIEHVTHGLSGALGTHWDKDFVPFWQTIRSAHQENQGRLAFVVAGVNPACVERSHFETVPNPIFQLAVPRYLEPLAREAVRSMVRTIGRYAGLRFDEEVFAYLQDTYGGHPYLIRIACSEVLNSLPPIGTKGLSQVHVSHFVDRRESIRTRLAQPIKDVLLSLVWWYPDEYDLLRIVASGDDAFAKEFIREHAGSTIQFAKYGLLRDGTAEFSIPVLKEFLKEHGDKYKRELSRFHRGDMPPELLPEVPDLAQLGRLFEKKCQIEIRLRATVLMYLGVKHNWDNEKISKSMIAGLKSRADRRKPEDLFVGRTPQEVATELYTLDLKEIISANWDAFSGLFDNNKVRFEMNMETINKARRIDGHVKPVPQNELEDYENSYNWMSRRLSKVPLPNLS